MAIGKKREGGREKRRRECVSECVRSEVTGVEGRLTKMMILSIYIQDVNCRT